MPKYNEVIERAVPTVSTPYREDLTSVDKAFLAVNSSLWRSPKDAMQEGVISAKIFSNVELSGGATDIDVQPMVRRMNKNALQDPVAFFKTINAEVNYVDYTNEVTDDSLATKADLDSLDTLANGDAFFVGFSEPFVGVSLEIHGTNKNNNAAVLSAHYEKVGGYQALSIKDFTKAAGKTLAHDGEILWEEPSDWIQTTKNGVLAYWVRFTVNNALSANVDVQECGVLLDYAYTGKLTTINVNTEGRHSHSININGDDVVVLISAHNGGGSILVDFDIGWN